MIGSRSARSLDEQSPPAEPAFHPRILGLAVRLQIRHRRFDSDRSLSALTPVIPGFPRGLRGGVRFWGLLRLNLMLVAGVLAGFAAFSPAT